MTSANHDPVPAGTPGVVSAGDVHPLLVIYIGKANDIMAVRSGAENRLQAYVSAGVVLGVDMPVDVHPQAISETPLPTFDEFIGINNRRRYDRNGADVWAAQNVVHSELRVLVCVLDATVESQQLHELYQRAHDTYAGRGVETIVVSLLWMTEKSVQISGPKGASSYLPQMFVNPKRLNDTLHVVADVIVNWVTTGLLGHVTQKLDELQAQKKSLLAVWLSTSTVYVDLPYVLQALYERVTHRFMVSWRSNPVNPQAMDELQGVTRKHAMSYDEKISQSITELHQKMGWQIKSNQTFVYQQTLRADSDVSGFPRVDTPLAKGLFGSAVGWWLGHWGTQITSMFVGLMAKVRMAFAHPAELNIADKSTMIAALQQQYHEAHVQMRNGLAGVSNDVYRDLQGFFFTYLYRFDDPTNRDYGLKRMLCVIDKYTDALEQSVKVKLFKQITGKTEEIAPIPSLHEDYLTVISTEHAEHLERLQLKWVRERASLLSFVGIVIRAIVMYPLLLSLLYAYAPAYFVDGPVVAIVLAVVLIVLAVALYTWSHLAYFASIERDRDRYFAEYITPTMLSIAAHYVAEYRRQLVVKLRRLHAVYRDIDVTIDRQNTTAGASIANVQGTRHFVIRELDTVFGGRTIVVDDRYHGEQWDGLRNEEAYIYERMGHVYASWHSQVKYMLNRRGNSHQKAEVTLLHELAEKLFEQRRQSDTALNHLRDQIEEPIKQIVSTVPISLDEVVELVPGLSNGNKWCWLATQAKIDAVPRAVSGFTVHKFTYFAMQEPVSTLAGASGQVSQCYAQYAPTGVFETRLPHEMSRIELEFDVK